MRRIVPILALALAACDPAPQPPLAQTKDLVRISLPDEPAAPWSSPVIEANCAACHSPEMIANQPPLDAKKWQATIDKMRDVYKAPVAKADDAALVAALMGTQQAR